jgi:hypothetical protein
MKKSLYKRLMMFLDGFIIVVVAFFSQNLVMLFSKLVLLFLIESSSPTTFTKTKHLEKFTKLHLHYNVNLVLSSLFSSLVFTFQIPSPNLRILWIRKNKKWNWDKWWMGYGTKEDFVNNFNIIATFKGFFKLQNFHPTRSSIIITCECLMSII